MRGIFGLKRAYLGTMRWTTTVLALVLASGACAGKPRASSSGSGEKHPLRRGTDSAQVLVPPSFPRQLALVLTPSQRRTLAHRMADESKAWFAAGMTLQPATAAGEAAVPVRVKLRGDSSLGCTRKSFTIDFHGIPYRLLPGAAADRIVLISMCFDAGYIHQVTGLTLATSLGLFPPGFRLIALTIDDVSQGLYLLIAEPERMLRRNGIVGGGVRDLVRRRIDIDGEPPEIRHGVPDKKAARKRYADFVRGVEARRGPALRRFLRRHLDVDQDWRWIALMTLLEYGD